MSEQDRRTGESGRTYRLERAPMARGGQGTVWGGVRDDGLAVAVKVAEESAVSRDALERERDLLVLLAEQQVKSVAEVLDFMDWDGRPALVMPRYPGDANAHVEQLIRGYPGVAIEAILGFGTAVCAALAGLHRVELPLENGGTGLLVHRDVKPENILVDADGGVRLVDFGGTLVVDTFQAVRLAVFGSPLWAPYDQILPDLPEPNPTWDTYAASVVLFWWITGTRPAYQADPTPMLTTRGRAIWARLTELARAPVADREASVAAHRAFQAEREGSREADLVEVRGHAALQPEDLEAISEGLSRLADPEVYGEEAIQLCARDLAIVLGRGLSPLSHPSPPNRFWEAGALSAELDAVRRRLEFAREALAAGADRASLAARVEAMEQRLLPGAALPILSEPVSEEEGLDPVPREVRAPRSPPHRGPSRGAASAPSGASRWWLGALIGLLLFGVMSIPLAIGLLRWWGGQQVLDATGPALIQGGAFFFGDPAAPDQNGKAASTVTLAPFRMDRVEVSNGAYATCVSSGACAPLSMGDPTEAAAANWSALAGAEQPAVGVTQTQAKTYCAHVGGRLPSEAEWEMAATWGPDATGLADKRPWPWGDSAPTCAQANAAACGRNTTLQVDMLPDGASAYGVLNLAGNAMEWTSTAITITVPGKVRGLLKRREADREERRFVLRGGAYDSDVDALRPTARSTDLPDAVKPTYGFRCVYDND